MAVNFPCYKVISASLKSSSWGKPGHTVLGQITEGKASLGATMVADPNVSDEAVHPNLAALLDHGC